jgi:hypothetical protein
MIPRFLLPGAAFLVTLAPFSFSVAETLQATAVVHGDQDGGTDDQTSATPQLVWGAPNPVLIFRSHLHKSC